MIEWLVAIGALFLVILFAVSASLYRIILQLSKIEKRLRPVSTEDCREEYGDLLEDEPWASEQGFEFVGVYLLSVYVGTTRITAWSQPDKHRFFCVYSIEGKTTWDFVTEFEGDVSLTTGSTKDGQLMPDAPRSFTQVFEGTPVHGLWSEHVKSEEFLMKASGLRQRSRPISFEDSFIGGTKAQVAYIRSLPFWPLLGVYWYFVRRHKLKNRSVEQQFQLGWLP